MCQAHGRAVHGAHVAEAACVVALVERAACVSAAARVAAARAACVGPRQDLRLERPGRASASTAVGSRSPVAVSAALPAAVSLAGVLLAAAAAVA